MLGTIINAAGIVIGGLLGLCCPGILKPKQERTIQVLLGAFTVFYGLRLVVISFDPPFTHILKQFGIIILALMLGRMAGTLFRLQIQSNQIGQNARETFGRYTGGTGPADVGFKMCAALYCAAPLGIVGAAADGSSAYFYPLIVKGIMDGLATMGFVKAFGWGPLLSAVPVFAFQGSIALLSKSATQHLPETAIHSFNAVSGFLIFAVALVILQIKRLRLADYLPSLVFAPVFGYWFR
jgi:uncharacterized membrane protein YqgA involved in biofilm formation